MLTFNVHGPAAGFQRRSALEKSMRGWFNGLQSKCVLCGPGGIGKSTLARNFAAARTADGASKSLRLVFVLSDANLEQDYLGLLIALLESDSGSAACAARSQQLPHSKVREKVHAFLCAAEWRGLWLGVLDDLPAPEAMEKAGLDLLEEFPFAHGRTIITTRSAEWTKENAMSVAFDAVEGGDDQRQCEQCGQCPPALLKGKKCGRCRMAYYCCRECQQQAWKQHKPLCILMADTGANLRSVADIMGLAVGSFAEEEACSWLKAKVPQWGGEDEGILELVTILECFPLAVAQVAEQARIYSPATPAEYLDELRRVGLKSGKGRRKRDEYPECFPDVVKLALDKILQSDQAHAEEAGQALRKLALADPEAIPLDLLSTDEKKAVILLQEHLLVTVDDKGNAAMHALTQLVVRNQLTTKAQRPALVAALAEVLAAKLGKFSYKKPATYFIGRRYARHAGAVMARAREWGVLPVAGDVGSMREQARGGGGDGSVLDNIRIMCQHAGGFFEDVNAQYHDALRMHEADLDCAVAGHGFDHVFAANAHNNIGEVYRKQDKHEEALVQYHKSLEINIRVLGQNSLSVAANYNNVGLVYQLQDKHEEALVQHQKSLEIRIRVFGRDSPEVAASYNNIGLVYGQQGKHGMALVHLQKSLEIDIRVFGQDSFEVAGSYNNIGMVYKIQGKHEEALVQHTKSLGIRIRVLGQDSPDTAASYNNIGMVYDAQGKHEEALVQYQKSLEIRIRVFGPEHGMVAVTKYNMARLYQMRNEMDTARELFLECEKIYSEVHGPGHSTTIEAALLASQCVQESV